MRKAPGKSYRNGISLAELFQMFPDNDASERWFEEQRWGEAGKPSHCPLCGGTEKQKVIQSRKPLPPLVQGVRRRRPADLRAREEMPAEAVSLLVSLDGS